MSIPAFGLGTFRLQGQVVIDSVSTGLDLGYRVIDTAQIYGNEAEVGQAIAASGTPPAMNCSSPAKSGSPILPKAS